MSTTNMPRPSFWRGKRVLLTGHTGFKGAWISTWLDLMEAQLCGFALAPDTEPSLSGSLDPFMESHLGDIRNLHSVSAVLGAFQPEIVIHLAAQALVRESYENPVETFAINVMGTTNVLEAARTSNSVQVVLVVTTDKCYENQSWVWSYRENDRLGGRDPYSSSKACAELVTEAYRRSFLESQGIRVATARAGNVIGGGDYARDRLVPDAIRAFTDKSALEIRQPHATRPWQHVLDPLCGYLLLSEKLYETKSGFCEAFNFGPSDEHEVRAVVERLVSGWGKDARVEVSSEVHPHEASRLHLDSSKSRHKLGWRPRLDLQKSVDWSIQFYQSWMRGSSPQELIREDIRRYLEL